jgi:hypothetical protein
MEGRKILDGIVVAHEAIHSLKVSKKSGDVDEIGYV